MTIGTVKFFNSAKGFGFIAPDGGGKDVFVHATALEAAGMHSLNEGDKISFDTQPDAKGSKAVDLIDLDYPWWHTKDDTLDKISVESLQTVGDVMMLVIRGERP